MELAAAPWYASSTFWTIAGPVVAVISTLVIAWVTIRVANPKRRLMYAMPVTTPLLNSVADVTAGIEVRRGGQILRSPRVVEVKLSTRGRSDIPRSAFDGGRPIRLDIGTPIVQCLKVSTDPDDRSMPDPKIDGSALLIGPALIGKRQTTVFALLVDGPEPNLSKPEQTLIDVDIQKRDPDVSGSAMAAAAYAAVALAVALVAPVALAAAVGVPGTRLEGALMVTWTAVLAVALVALAVAGWFEFRNRR